MPLSRRVKNAATPWAIYMVVTGLASGMICSALIAGLIVILLVFSFINGDLMNQLHSKSNVLDWLIFWLGGSLFGALIGLWVGAVSSLIGGAAGKWWCFLSVVGLICLSPSFSRTAGATLFSALPLVLLSLACTKFAADLLEWDVPRFQWDVKFRKRVRGSWLQSPPYSARFCGLIFPIATGLMIWLLSIFPVFWGHLNYVSRLGLSRTWHYSELEVKRDNQNRWSSSSCQSNLKQIMLGLLQYQQDFDETYPPQPHSPAQGVAAIIQPYVKSTQLFQCPQDFIWSADDRFSSGDFTDYWYNSRLYGVTDSHLKVPQVTLAWGDGNTGAGEANAAYSLRSIPPNFVPATRHRNGANYAFMDGHVKWLKLDQISDNAPSVAQIATMNP